jgi:glycerol-3-phosphate dehydrogenase (NAD(P)+)
MKIAVLGAGAWGTALARAAAQGHETLLWARDPEQARALREQRCNRRYLDGIELPAALSVTADRAAALAHGRDGLTLIATPMSALRDQLATVGDARPLLWLC